MAGQSTESNLDGYLVLDASLSYQYNDNLRLFSRIENLADEEYVAAARPFGLRPGKPQSLYFELIIKSKVK